MDWNGLNYTLSNDLNQTMGLDYLLERESIIIFAFRKCTWNAQLRPTAL